VIEVREGGTEEWYLSADEVGLSEAPLEQVAGGEPAENAAITRAVLAGEPGPHRDLALLNAGAAIYVADEAGEIDEGVSGAAEAVDSGAAAGVLQRLVQLTDELAGG
jgi:anthranilate phosphoribosyltransferase